VRAPNPDTCQSRVAVSHRIATVRSSSILSNQESIRDNQKKLDEARAAEFLSPSFCLWRDQAWTKLILSFNDPRALAHRASAADKTPPQMERWPFRCAGYAGELSVTLAGIGNEELTP
jgi:hypothetical protein